jgi:hypothetical protein
MGLRADLYIEAWRRAPLSALNHPVSYNTNRDIPIIVARYKEDINVREKGSVWDNGI